MADADLVIRIPATAANFTLPGLTTELVLRHFELPADTVERVGVAVDHCVDQAYASAASAVVVEVTINPPDLEVGVHADPIERPAVETLSQIGALGVEASVDAAGTLWFHQSVDHPAEAPADQRPV